MNICFPLSDLNYFDDWFEAARDRLLSEVDRMLAVALERSMKRKPNTVFLVDKGS